MSARGVPCEHGVKGAHTWNDLEVEGEARLEDVVRAANVEPLQNVRMK